jgi:hypothetical protein
MLKKCKFTISILDRYINSYANIFTRNLIVTTASSQIVRDMMGDCEQIQCADTHSRQNVILQFAVWAVD